MFPRNSKILICDDSPISRELAKRILGEDGFMYLEDASSAQEVVDVLSNNKADPYDLLLLDIVMPGMSGTDLVKVIRKSKSNYKDLCIIMISSEAEKQVVLKALVNGANEYLLKPVDRESLEKKMETVWNKLTETQRSEINQRAEQRNDLNPLDMH